MIRLADNATTIQITPGDLNLSGAPTNVGSDSVANILGIVYFWAAIIAVLVIIVGGIRYATANGDSSKVKTGKDTILYAIVGLVVIIMATAITQFVIDRIGK
jgi:hypothetical protein